MSLLSDAFEECVMLDKISYSDGYGSVKQTYVSGAIFYAAITFNSSMQARIAQKQDVSSLYTVTTKRATTLMFHDVFKRKRDGKIFRVTSDGDDEYTPKSASLDMRQVTAEEFTI